MPSSPSVASLLDAIDLAGQNNPSAETDRRLYPLASDRVHRVCLALRGMQILDETYALRSAWRPSMAVGEIVERVLRPSVYLLQSVLDPGFRSDSMTFQLEAPVLNVLRQALRKILELVVRYCLRPTARDFRRLIRFVL